MNIRANILLRVYLAFGLIVLFALAVVIQLCRVQFVQGKKWRAISDSLSIHYVNVAAARGNILAVDGSLLATSVPEYDLHMDMLAGAIDATAHGDRTFNLKVDSLAMTEQKIVEMELEYQRLRGLLAAQEALLLQNPAGNWVNITESRGVR